MYCSCARVRGSQAHKLLNADGAPRRGLRLGAGEREIKACQDVDVDGKTELIDWLID